MSKSLFVAVAFAVGAAGQAAAAERLVLEPYPAETPWQEVMNQTTAMGFVREQIPAGQVLGKHTDILAAHSLPKIPGVTPTEFLTRMFGAAGARCLRVKVNGPFARVEGGYDVAYGQIHCNQEIGAQTGASMFFKLIAGDEAVYMINREFRTPPSEEPGMQVFAKGKEAEAKAVMDAMAAADDYLGEHVYLCGARSTDARCKG